MSNQERLKEYLLGKDGENPKEGYLKSDLSKGKIIMLSGAWGSGKTHFWQNIIQKDLNKEDSKIPNHYVSLYGKTSIDEIKTEVFLKVFESVDSFKLKENAVKAGKNIIGLASTVLKTINIAGVSIDLKDVSDKPFDFIEKLMSSEKLEKTEHYLNSGAVICFDDFERKSKEIDLNDLFGFITQLTLQFDCKVMIVLNDDAFEGKDKEVFSKVKEKSVSKYLKYEPSVEELFESIFCNDKSKLLSDHRSIILKTLQEVGEINARIYMQVLDNLLEWIEVKQSTDDKVLRSLILANINFILFHTIEKYDEKQKVSVVVGFDNQNRNYNFNRMGQTFEKIDFEDFDKYFNFILERLFTSKDYSEEYKKNAKVYLEVNKIFYHSEFFMNYHDIFKDVDVQTIEKINNFIETGILYDE